MYKSLRRWGLFSGGGAGGNGSTGGLSGGTGAVTDHLFASSLVLEVTDEKQAGRCKGSSRNNHGSRNRSKQRVFSSRNWRNNFTRKRRREFQK
ncbi:hypothetical protein OIU78_022835 [Salix suchowensis]|nr:hypothetical protein OIU78_022835 [Salix suchowensis]